MYQDRNNAKTGFTHHTQCLCLNWSYIDRKRVLNSLYTFSLVQARLKPVRQSKNEMLSDVKQPEVEHFWANLGGLSTKVKSSIQTRSSPVSYRNINGESLGITVALSLY